MRRPQADERDLWRRAMRDVAPLRGRAPTPPAVPDRGHPARSSADAGKPLAVPSQRPNRHQLAALPPLDRAAGVDRASAERLRRGRLPVEARLDLHGLTQAEAHRALRGFLAASRAAGRRVVLVITGHGRLSGGILKAAVPRWLEEPELRHHLLASAPARPQDGGAGALCLLLRRRERTG